MPQRKYRFSNHQVRAQGDPESCHRCTFHCLLRSGTLPMWSWVRKR